MDDIKIRIEKALEKFNIEETDTIRDLLKKTNTASLKVLNEYIGKMFADGNPVDYFKPKKNPDETGEVREVSGGKFIGIIGGNHIRVIAVKGSPSGLPSLPSEGQNPIAQALGK